MKKNIVNIFVLIILIFFGYQILLKSSLILESVSFSFKIWQYNIFPSLFPFFILSELLINYGFVEVISLIFRPVMYRLFGINSNAAFIFVMSMISGFPSSAKYTKELYLKGLLNSNEASKVLTFTHFSNPLFILGTVSILFLQNKEVGLLILFCHYITNIIIGIIFKNYYKSSNNNKEISFKELFNLMNNDIPFGKVINHAIESSIQTLFLILGTVTVFLVVTTIITTNLNLDPYYQSILSGFIEMTQGLKSVSLLDIPLKIKSILTVMILSFGGLSVHIQVLSIISDTKIKYLPFLTARLIHSSLSGIMVFILFDYWVYLL